MNSEFDKLKAEAENMQDFLDCVPPTGDITTMIEYGNQIATFHSRTAEMLKDAKYMLDVKMHDEILKVMEKLDGEKYSAKVQNALVDSCARDERMLVNWSDRLNSACKHRLDWIRSCISAEKELAKITGFQK